jgi:hypothetical protein
MGRNHNRCPFSWFFSQFSRLLVCFNMGSYCLKMHGWCSFHIALPVSCSGKNSWSTKCPIPTDDKFHGKPTRVRITECERVQNEFFAQYRASRLFRLSGLIITIISRFRLSEWRNSSALQTHTTHRSERAPPDLLLSNRKSESARALNRHTIPSGGKRTSPE